MFVGFNVTFLRPFILGSQGVLHRDHSYDVVTPKLLPLVTCLHSIATVGSFILAAGLLLVLFYLLHSLYRGVRAPDNQGGGVLMEWQITTPSIKPHFEEQPIGRQGPYEYPEIRRLEH